MAVSQFLRPGSLLESVRSYLTPDVVHNASSLVGESESSTRQALQAATPSVLGGLANMASTHEGAGNLANMLRGGGYGSVLENAGSLFAGGGATTSMLSTGHQLLGRIFGNRGSVVTDAVAKSGGVSSASASKLTALAAPLVLGVLGKRAAEQKLDSSGLANTLLSERSEIASAAPSSLSQLLNPGPTMVRDRTETTVVRDRPESTFVHEEEETEPVGSRYVDRAAPAHVPTRGSRWPLLAFAILAALVLLGLLLFLGRNPRRVGETAANAARNAAESVNLPGGQTLSLAPGSLNYQLAHFLGDSNAQAPRTFVFDNLNFESNGTQLTPGSQGTVNNLGSIMKAYPSAHVQLTGYTDNTGAADTNQALSLNRANAVKAMLTDQGIAPDRITTQGLGEQNPVASNDTEDGRARNRRTELTVTSK